MEIESKNLKAKQGRLESWKLQNVYQQIDGNVQPPMSIQWVLKPKIVDGNISTKAKLCVTGFKEIKELETDLPTCSRDSVEIATSLMASFK